MKKQTLGYTIVVTLFAAYTHAATLVQWDTTGATGEEVTFAPTFSTLNIAGLDLSRGAGLTPSLASNNFGSSGFTGEATDFVSLGLTVADGFSVSISQLTIAGRSSNSGPGSIGIYSSLDGFMTAVATLTMSGTAYTNEIFDLSGAGLTDLTGSVEFRLVAIGTTSANGGTIGSSGTFRIGNHYDSGTSTSTPITFDGTVTAVPEPSTVGLCGLGISAVLFGANRRRRK